MDRIEGHRTEEDPPNYEPVPVVVAGLEEDEIEATTYVGRSDARKRCATEHADAVVERTYAEAVLRGAREANLLSHYVSFLERTVVSGIDDVRSDENRKVVGYFSLSRIREGLGERDGTRGTRVGES